MAYLDEWSSTPDGKWDINLHLEDGILKVVAYPILQDNSTDCINFSVLIQKNVNSKEILLLNGGHE